MKQRRRVSRATRAKISRGLKRYYRAERKKQRARRVAAKKAARTRAIAKERKVVQRGARTMRQLETKPKAPRAVQEEWEVTIRYEKGGELVAVSVVVLMPNPLPDGSLPDREKILGAVWRASRGQTLTIADVQAVDWRREVTTRSGARKVYDNSGVAEDLKSFYYLMRKGATFRAERVGE